MIWPKMNLKKKMHWSVKLNDVRIRKVKILCFLWIEQQKLNEKLHQGSRFSIVFCAIFLLMTARPDPDTEKNKIANSFLII